MPTYGVPRIRVDRTAAACRGTALRGHLDRALRGEQPSDLLERHRAAAARGAGGAALPGRRAPESAEQAVALVADGRAGPGVAPSRGMDGRRDLERPA